MNLFTSDGKPVDISLLIHRVAESIIEHNDPSTAANAELVSTVVKVIEESGELVQLSHALALCPDILSQVIFLMCMGIKLKETISSNNLQPQYAANSIDDDSEESSPDHGGNIIPFSPRANS